MASTLINSLYPPFVDTFMPAFVEDGVTDGETQATATIQFSISPYNATETVKYVHVTLINQATNRTVLGNGAYGTLEDKVIQDGILAVPFSEDLFNEDTGLYEIQIPRSYLKRDTTENNDEVVGKFQLGVFYQAQLRFDNTDMKLTTGNLLTHLIADRAHFSEWSEVTLLRAIPRPIFEFNNIDPETSTTAAIRLVKNEQGDLRYTKEDKSNANYSNQEYNKGLIPVSATVNWYFNGSIITTGEHITQTRVYIHEKNKPANILADSGIMNISNDEEDSIYFLADMNQAKEETDYIIHVEGVSRNGYEWWDEREITVSAYNNIPFNLSWNFNKVRLNTAGDEIEKIVTEEDGFIKCQITSTDSMPPGYLYIFRTSSLDNYKHNEVIQVSYENGTINTTFEDRTVGSLVRYRYKAQYKIKATETWTKVQAAPTYVYPDFYDMLFLRQDKQLAVRFDGNFSSLKPVVNRTKIDTLGGKYPRFAENAMMNYKQFALSGLISSEEDYNRQFLNEKTDSELKPGFDAYDDEIGSINLLRNDTILESVEHPTLEGFHDTYPHNNWYWEREFREKAMQWLNDGEPKLFRSMTEGNMIVMLTDINLTPANNTDRRLYQFTATMYEIGDGNDYDQLIYHKIITRRDDEEVIKSGGKEAAALDNDYITISKVGQYVNTYFTYDDGNFNVIGLNNGDQGLQLNDDTGSYNLATASLTDYVKAELRGINRTYRFIEDSIRLQDVRIQFTSKPYWMRMSGNELVRIEDDGNVDPSTPGLMLGYSFYIKVDENQSSSEGNQLIFVGPKGFYEIPSEMTVKELIMHPSDDFTIDYKIEYLTEYDTSGLVQKTETLRKIVGQHSGVFEPYVWLGDDIREKYHFTEYVGDDSLMSLKSEELMETWTGLSFDVTPYADIYIRQNENSEWEERVVGQTGVYNLMTDYPIYDVYFAGRRMTLAKEDNRPYLDEWNYVLDQTVTNEKPTDEEDIEDYWYDIVEAAPNSPFIQETDNVVRVSINQGVKQGVYSWWQELDYSKEQELYGYIYLKNIKNPQYNTIYKVVDADGSNPIYVIYYLDQGWYPVTFTDDTMQVAIAQVPISGMINYRGTVIRYTYLT